MEKIVIILGSKSDHDKVKDGIALLEDLGVKYKLEIISAHRNPEKLRNFCAEIQDKGVQVVIACAGMAAALPGFVASYVDIPVIGVALEGGLMGGLDALFSVVSSPKGIGLVCSGVGKSAVINAIISSLQILALKDKNYLAKLKELKGKFK